MNPVVQAQLTEFSKVYKSEMGESELFEVFSIFSICNGVLTDNVDPFDVHLTGDEFGLDGVAIMVQGELCRTSEEVSESLSTGKNHTVEFNFFQSKTSEKMDYGDLSKFFDSVSNFFSSTVLDNSPQLDDLQAAKNAVYAAPLKENPVLRLFYVTTGSGEISRPIAQLVETTKTRFGDMNIFSEVEIDLFGAKQIQAGYRSATNSIVGNVKITNPITLPEHASVQQGFLGLIDAPQLIELVTTEKRSRINKAVFFDNVRDFDAKSEINQGILNELESGGQSSFVFKNNGVTVVARNIIRTGDSFRLEDFQVVNGCQTSNILFLAGKLAEGVQVPFRLIGSDDPAFISSIIVGTNKQNEVREDQFWALKPFMKDLEEYCSQQEEKNRIFIERRENQYRQEDLERTRISKPRDLFKSIIAMYLFQPHRAARDYRGVMKEFGSKIFQDKHSVVPYHAAALATYWIDFSIRNRKVPKEWGIYKYYFMASLGYEATGGRDIFTMKRAEANAVSKAIATEVSDEKLLIKKFAKAEAKIRGMLPRGSAKNREKIRDYIRSDSVAKSYLDLFK